MYIKRIKMRHLRRYVTKAGSVTVRSFRRMPIAEPERALSSRIPAVLVVRVLARKIIGLAACQMPSTTFQSLTPIFNDLHELSTTYEISERVTIFRGMASIRESGNGRSENLDSPGAVIIFSLPVQTVNFVIRFTKFITVLLILKLTNGFLPTSVDR